MRFKAAKFTVLGERQGDVAVLAIIYDSLNQMAMSPILAFSKGKLIAADVPACVFGPEEDYAKAIQDIEDQLPQVAKKREEGEFDDGREAEEFIFEGLDRFGVSFDKAMVLEKLDQAAEECFKPAKHYGWLSPPRGWTREPNVLST